MQTIDLNLTSGGVPPVVHASQGDVMLPVKFVIYDNGEEVTIPSGAVVSIRGTKADGHSFSYSSDSDTSVISWDGSTVSVYTSEQMTAAAGVAIVELRMSVSGIILHTANFLLDVEASALPADADLSKSDIPIIEQAINAGETAAASAKEAAASAKEAAASAKEAAQSITGVSSWNGRTGAVKPQSGDYTAAMVGALAQSDVTSTYSASGTSPVNGKAVAAAVKDKTDTTYVDKADAALNTRLTSAEGTIASQGTRLTSAEGTIASQGTRLTSAENSISTLVAEYKIGDRGANIANTQHFLVATITGVTKYSGASLLFSCVGARDQGSTIAFVHIDNNSVKTTASGGIAAYTGTVFPVEAVLTSDGAKIYITSVNSWSFASVKALQFVTTSPTVEITMQSDQVGISSLSPDLTIK